MPFTIAIDGPAASGKGTIARALALRFSFHHLDTGLLYRAVGARGGDPIAAARSLSAEDLARGDLRSAEAGQAASRVAAIPEVRAALVAFQRAFARQEPGAVLDGRDIGTVIAPQAEVKLWVTAAPEVRARRRYLELAPKRPGLEEATILAELAERDGRDASNMKKADDAHLLDTSAMDIEQAFQAAVAIVERAK